MDVHDELFDVVDQQNNVIGQETRYYVHKHNLLHRAIHIILTNRNGDVFMQKRSMNKDLLPGCWATSCSGHVDAGETYAQAAVRELQEELGITVAGIEAMKPLFSHPACPATGNEFIQVYGLTWDGPVNPNPEEISAGRWVTPAVLDKWIEHAPSDFAASFLLVWEQASVLCS